MLFHFSPLFSIYVWPASTLLQSFQTMDFGLECWRDISRLWSIEHIGLASICLSSSEKSTKTSATPNPKVHCPSAFHCQQSPRLSTLFCPLILDHGVCLIIPSGIKNSQSVDSARHFFLTIFSICDNQVQLSSDESPSSKNSNTVLSFSDSRILNLYNPSPRCHHAAFSSLTIKFHPILIRIPEYRHFEEQ